MNVLEPKLPQPSGTSTTSSMTIRLDERIRSRPEQNGEYDVQTVNALRCATHGIGVTRGRSEQLPKPPDHDTAAVLGAVFERISEFERRLERRSVR